MPLQRYFLEVQYKGTGYSGFQAQKNAPNTIQEETEKAFAIVAKQQVTMTGSSRTDTGVHALQNFFHFDFDSPLQGNFLYKLNAVLPKSIVACNIYPMQPEAHCRFDAVARSYCYRIYRKKNPFLADRAYYLPYSLNLSDLQAAAAIIKTYADFTSFSKRNTQVKTFLCAIADSVWKEDGDELVYYVKANRFLRGMVKGLTGTMLQVGRGKITLDQLRKIIEAKDCRLADFSVPGHGLFLTKVAYPTGWPMVPLRMNQGPS